MMGSRSSNGTSATADNIKLASPLDGRDTAQFAQSAHGRVDSLLTAFSGETCRLLPSQLAPHLAQCLPQPRWFQPFRNSTQYQIEQRSIRLWEYLFDCRG